MAIDISTEDFGRAVLQRSHEIPVVVDFWAEWCGPCHTLGPILEKVASETEIELVKVDVDANQELASQFGVQGIPNVIGFRSGEAVSRFTGAIPEAGVRDWVNALLPSGADLAVERARDAILAGDEALAETLFREALDQDADHQDAGTGLAALLIARGETADALIVLGKLSPTAEVQRLQAAARLTASQGTDVAEFEAALEQDSQDTAARLSLGTALAAKGEYEPGLDHLLAIVVGKGPDADAAKAAMLDIFGVLGVDHPLTVEYRRRLASVLF
ncbi:MAG: thioredoxin [Acidimicrobiia bacterium]